METLKLKESASSLQTTTISVETIKNLTSKNEKSYDARCYFAVMMVGEFFKLNTKYNIRGYIGELSEKKRTKVHKAMEATLNEKPERWIQLNSPATVTTGQLEIKNDGTVVMSDDSLVNGCQSQGELMRWLADVNDGDLPEVDTQCRVEILVEPDFESRKLIAIARNFSNKVQFNTEANARGYLDTLASAIDGYEEGWKLQRHETDHDANIPVQKLLQITRCFIPDDLLKTSGTKAYASASSCLADFCKWQDGETDLDKALCKFTLEMAPIAWKRYLHWNSHKGWKGKNLQEIYKTSGKKPGRKLKDDNWTDIHTGILIPMLSAEKWFTEINEDGRYVLNISDKFIEDDHIKEAIEQFRDANYNPLFMGRNKSAYVVLEAYPKALSRGKKNKAL